MDALAGILVDAVTVQLHPATPPNQPHRAEVAKLLVHRAARRRGLAPMLMARVEAAARAHGRTLLTLDTSGSPDYRAWRTPIRRQAVAIGHTLQRGESGRQMVCPKATSTVLRPRHSPAGSFRRSAISVSFGARVRT